MATRQQVLKRESGNPLCGGLEAQSPRRAQGVGGRGARRRPSVDICVRWAPTTDSARCVAWCGVACGAFEQRCVCLKRKRKFMQQFKGSWILFAVIPRKYKLIGTTNFIFFSFLFYSLKVYPLEKQQNNLLLYFKIRSGLKCGNQFLPQAWNPNVNVQGKPIM